MSSNRIGRINEEIQRELSALIPAVKDPRVSGMISVTAVETTPDLRYAKAYISVLDKENGERVLKGLRSASGCCAGSWRRLAGERGLPLYLPDKSLCGDNAA